MESTENDYEWEIINTHTGRLTGWLQGSIVWWVLKKRNRKKKHGEHKHYFLPFQEFLFTQKCDFEKFVNVFLCFAEPAESRNNGEAFSSYKNKTEKSYLGHTVAGGRQLTVVAAGHCWWIWAASAAVQLSPRSSVLSKTYQKYRLVKPDKRSVNF